MQDDQPGDVPPLLAEERRRVLARRIGAVLFALAFLLDVLSDGQLLGAVSRLCGS